MRHHSSGNATPDDAMPRLTAEEREHIDKVAAFVARDGDGSERILLRLVAKYRRWGFLSKDHPHHSYYLHKKVSEQCRAKRLSMGP